MGRLAQDASRVVVAIDGPAGVGKSTTARRVAEQLGWAHLDSGAMYRGVAAAAIEQHVLMDAAEALGRLAGDVDVVLEADGTLWVDGRDLTRRIREEDVTRAVARVAAAASVREGMVRHQRAFARRAGRVVAEGRDMGTVVFPDAEVKVFLDADPAVRAARRLAEAHPGATADGPESRRVQADMAARDAEDRGRRVAPLVPAEDAWHLDTTRMTLDEVVAAILAHVRSRVPVMKPPHPGA